MNPISTQQATLDNALVPLEKRLKIERCNARIAFSKPQREETYQFTLEALKLSPCCPAFLITAEVLEIYMHQFWNTIRKIIKTDAYNFKLDKKKCRVDTEELGYSGKYNMLSAIHTDQMHQPWRTFAAIINKCIYGKTTRLDRLKESRAQILWGMYNKKNVDYVALLCEDFMYQADNREISSARKENMPYPRFTKVIINHFISKNKTISMRNIINLHIVHNDYLLGTSKFVSKTDDAQKLNPRKQGNLKKLLHPQENCPVLEAEPVKKAKRVKRPAKKSTTTPTAGVVIRDTPGVSVSKKKAPAKGDKGKGMELLSDLTLLEATQVKEALKKSKLETHKVQASGSSEGVGSQPKVPDESEDKIAGTDERTDDESNDDGDDNDSHNKDGESKDDDGNSDADDNERTNSDDDDANPSFTLKDYDEE
ncbi:hypothetical protein Tco_1291020 [Tanacetum coccineum]